MPGLLALEISGCVGPLEWWPRRASPATLLFLPKQAPYAMTALGVRAPAAPRPGAIFCVVPADSSHEPPPRSAFSPARQAPSNEATRRAGCSRRASFSQAGWAQSAADARWHQAVQQQLLPLQGRLRLLAPHSKPQWRRQPGAHRGQLAVPHTWPRRSCARICGTTGGRRAALAAAPGAPRSL